MVAVPHEISLVDKMLFTVNVNVVPELAQVFAFVTVIVPVYVPTFVLPGTLMPIGLVGKLVLATFTNPADNPAASHVILYFVGVPVVAEYFKLDVCALLFKHTLSAVAATVIDGTGLTVKVNVVPALEQPPALVTTIVPV